MRKIRLDPDNLEVESFRTVADMPAAGGTVHARETVFTYCTCDYDACTGAYYTCDAHCGHAQSADVQNTCDLQCTGGGGTGGNSMHTACLDCYSQAQGCTAFDGCHTVVETCYPCG